MKRLLPFLLTTIILGGCANLPPPGTAVNTLFGGISREPDTPDPTLVQQRMARSQLEGISLDEITRRMADTENCILRRTAMTVDHCLCYSVYGVPPGKECIEPNQSSVPPVESSQVPLPTAREDRRAGHPPFPDDWKAWTKEKEGCKPTLVNGHIGCGHSCAENADCHLWHGVTLDEYEMNALFDDDWRKAAERAFTNLDRADGPVTSLCFKHGCNGFNMQMLLMAADTGLLRDVLPAEAIKANGSLLH